jgi:hypothetical protein
MNTSNKLLSIETRTVLHCTARKPGVQAVWASRHISAPTNKRKMGNTPSNNGQPSGNSRYEDLDNIGTKTPELCGCGPEEVLLATNQHFTVDQQQRISAEKRLVAALRSGNLDRIRTVLDTCTSSVPTLDFPFPLTDLVICTPMHYAVKFLPLECVQILGEAILEHRNLNKKKRKSPDDAKDEFDHLARDQDGMTPLHYAVVRAGTVFDCSESISEQSNGVKDAFEILKYLASSGVCDPNAQDLVRAGPLSLFC